MSTQPLHVAPVRHASLALVVLLAAAPLVRAQGPGPLPPPPPPPPGNPTTPDKVLLGKTLFWDEQLSSTKTVSCATCHVPERGGSDPRSSDTNPASIHPGPNGLFGDADDTVGSPGVVRNLANGRYESTDAFGLHPQVTPRKAPSALNGGYAPILFWDGRATGTFVDPTTQQVLFPQGAALESQALGPVVADVEMASVGRTLSDLVARVIEARPLALSPQPSADLVGFLAGRSYPDLFQLAFGTNEVSAVRVAEAIAAYERTQFTNQTPFDQFLAGNPGALTPLENQGRLLFGSPALACNTCHTGALTTNHSFHYTGVRPQDEDLGRFNVTGNPGDRGAMKTPGLRNVELHAPYFHDGSARTLAEVVDFYDRGGDFDAPNKAPQIHPLGLTAQQKQALVAFLGRPLTDPRVPAGQPPFDHPVLYSDSVRVPQVFGHGTAGTGGFVPEIVALEPALIGNPSFALGLEHGLGGAQVVLGIDSASVAGGAPFQGATNYLAMSSSLAIVRAGRLQGTGAGAGWKSVTLALPADSGLIGQSLYVQWFVLDLGGGGRFAATPAAQLTFF